MKIKYTHTNINAYDWEKLSQFYKDVFGCYTVGPMRDLKGDWFEKVTGIKDAAVKGEHIARPGYPEGEGPTFEIFTYEVPEGERPAHINGYGFAHVAFLVEDVEEIFEKFQAHGGTANGELVKSYYPSLDQTLTVVYGLDPEGNSVEILNWKPGNCE